MTKKPGNNLLLFSLTALTMLWFAVPSATARVGVGVGLGKVNFDKPLSSGGIYKLPALPVLNTGDETATYHVFATYSTNQKERHPDSAWFSFEPKEFSLAPGGTQMVKVTLTLPVNAHEGSYFAYLEAQPQITAKGTTVGVASATKLSFTVANTNLVLALIERAKDFIAATAPVSYYLAIILTLVITIVLLRRFVNVKIDLKKKAPEQ